MSKGTKIGIAIFAGAFIGTGIFLAVNVYFCWVGLFAGGLIAYLAYDFKEVLSAIPRAYRAVINWRPNKDRLILLGWNSILAVVIVPTIFMGLMLIVLCFGGTVELINKLINSPANQPPNWMSAIWFISGLTAFLSVVMWSAFFSNLFENDAEKVKMDIEETKKGVKLMNPISVYFFYLPKGIFWLIKKILPMFLAIIRGIAKACALFAKFIWKVFLLIHSEERVLCLVDAAIGVGIGGIVAVCCGVPALLAMIIGGVSGVIVGIADYELLSKRLLSKYVKAYQEARE